jgi:hypothetical protein
MVTSMKARFMLVRFAAVFAMVVALAPCGGAHDQSSGNSPAPSSQQPQTPERREGFGRGAQGRGRPLFGKISAIHNDGIEITTQEGNKVSVKLDAKTEFRKERQPAKIGDFKVGDAVIVRTNQESDSYSGAASGATAIIVAAVPPGFAGRSGGGGPGGMSGTPGKDYVLGDVKSLDPPKLTILRTDNVTQTIELNEETSLRRGRDSITMADIQPGDHVFVRGATASDVFVPKGLNVIPPEQWKRMQEMNEGRGAAPQNVPPPATSGPARQQTPPEQRN